MKITDVHIDGFGVWTGLSLENLSDRVTVFFGVNEAGKTTLMQFVRSVLYGFTAPRRRRYLPPLHGASAGGTLTVCREGGSCEIRRRASEDDADGDLGRLRVIGPEGRARGADLLGVLLGDVDEAVFNNVFAIGLRELQQLGSLDDTRAAEQLYKLTSGLDRVSLVDVMQTLRTARERIVGAEGDNSQIGVLLARRSALEAEIDQLVQRGRCWPRLAAQRAALRQQADQLGETVERLEREARSVETALQVRQSWLARKQLDEQLTSLTPSRPLPEGALEDLSRLEDQLDQGRGRLAEIKRRRGRIREEAAARPLDRRLWSQRGRVAAMAEHSHWIASLQSQIDRLRTDVAAWEAERTDQGRRLGLSGEQTARGLPDVSPRMLAALRAPARAVRDESQRLEQARREQENSRRESLSIEQEVRGKLAHRVQGDLVVAVEQAGQRVAMLRRRLQIDERLEQMAQHRRDLEEQVQRLVTGGPPPIRVLAGLGILFIAGVMLILTGLLGGSFFGLPSQLGWPLAFLGVGGAGAAIVAKIMWERSSARRLESCREQLGLLQQQLEQAEKDRSDLRQQLPPQPGRPPQQLKTAQAELEQLEELLPLDAQRQAASQQSREAARRAAEAEQTLSSVRRQWKTTLQRLGLPDSLTPRQVRRLADHSKLARRLRRQLESRRNELAQREKELDRLAARIQQLFDQLQLEPASDDPQDPQEKLRQLTAALAEQEQRARHWAELRRRDRRLRSQQVAMARRIERLQQRRQSMLTAAGAPDLKEFRRLARQYAQRIPLQRRREQLAAQITAAIGKNRCEKTVLDELDQYGDGPDGATRLEQRWDQAVAQLQEMQTRRAQAHEQRRAVDQEMKSLAEDRRLAAARLELGCVEQQLCDAMERWRVLAVTEMLLESVRETYEKERQPETLREASEYLRQLTDRRHVRIWTPLGEDVLYVEDQRGDSLSLEVLSRGTREAVFLSLRLALASAYARRGADLPLVLDDVLVNLDAQRAKAAAAVLRDFAKSGRQVLLFTCHEHIRKLFKAARCDVRLLPSHDRLEPLKQQEQDEKEDKLTAPVNQAAPENHDKDERDALYEEETEEETDEYEEPYEESDEDEQYEYEEEEELEELEQPADAEMLDEDDEDDEDEQDEDDEDEQGDEYEDDEQDDAEDAYDWDEEEVEDGKDDPAQQQAADPDQREPADELEDSTAERDAAGDDDGSDSRRNTFTWESPERWWEGGPGGAAA